MKHTFRAIHVAMMAVATVAFIGCSKEESNNENSSANGGSNGGGDVPAGWVDLGLPSGLLWAECNVGATSPEGYGDHFAWGETATKDEYSWNTYRYCTVDGEGRFATLTKYNTSSTYGTEDNLTVLEPGDDAATTRLGDGARTPIAAEWIELINNTTVKWDTLNGVNGRKYIGSNGNSIFLPASGYYVSSGLRSVGSDGYYWSSSLKADNPREAWYFIFNYSDGHDMTHDGRLMGQTIRAVRAR